MANNNSTRIFAVVATLAIVAGLWWWLSGRAPEAENTDDVAASDKAARSADGADGPRATPLHTGHVDALKVARATAAGTVRDEAGQPIAGAQVCAEVSTREFRNGNKTEPHCVTTRKDGTFRIDTLLATEHRLFASARGYLPATYERRAGIQQHLTSQLEFNAGQTREGLDIVLKEGGVELTGVVMDISGGEIDGALVWISSSWRSEGSIFTHSDEEGRFSLWVEPGHTTVRAETEGYTTTSVRAQAPGTFVELFLNPESVIIGKVVWADSGEPVANAAVSTGRGRWSNTGSVRSEDDGSFRIEGLNPGSYKIRVEGGEMTGSAEQKVHVGLGQTSEPIIVRAFPAVTVEGMVFVDDKEPCSFGFVSLADANDKSVRQLYSHSKESGHIRIEGVLPGTYEVTVNCQGYLAEETYEDLVVGESSIDGLRWSVHPALSIRGRIVDEQGHPLEEATVYCQGKKDPTKPRARTVGGGSERTLADGEFLIPGLLPGTYELNPGHDDMPRPEKPLTVEVQEGADLNDVELVLRRGGGVSGTVRDESGKPVGQVSVRGQGANWGGSASTNDAGEFEIKQMVPGEYRVSARRGWREKLRAPGATDDDKAGERVTVVAGETTVLDLVVESQNGRITGRVLDEDGEPVADAFVHANRQSDSAAASAARQRSRASWGSWGRKPLLTDQDGYFELEELAEAGKYTVTANRKGGGEAVAENVEVGTNVELSIGQVGALSGLVTLAGGGYPERFTVSAVDKAQGTRASDGFFRTDGRWRLSNLPAGSYEITASANEGKEEIKLELADGAENTNVNIELTPRVTLTGKLVDADTGEPIAGMQVMGGGLSFRGFGSQKGGQTNISDANGNFEIEDVATGTITVYVMSPGFTDNDYGWTTLGRKIPKSPAVQDLGTIELLKERVGDGEEAGSSGFKRKEEGPQVEPEDVRNVVAFINPRGPAAKAGLAVGDEIVSVDGQDVRGLESYRYQRLLRAAPGTVISLGLADGRSVRLTLGPPE